MAWLAGGGHLKPKTPVRVERLSGSDEYEESDQEPEQKQQIFHVRKIVSHMKLNKGEVYKQARYLNHTFDINSMEDSKMDYAFKVRWRGFEEDEDTWEPIENFNANFEKKIRKYCKKKGIPIPDNLHELLMPMSDTEGNTSGSEIPTDTSRRNTDERPPKMPTNRPQMEEKKEKMREKQKMRSRDLLGGLSRSPSPQKSSNNENNMSFDPLFDSSGDEKKKRAKREKGDESETIVSGTQGKKNRTIDSDDAQRKEIKKKKIKSSEGKTGRNSLLSDDTDNDKEAEEKRKKNDRAELARMAAEHIKKLEEEEKRKKERKQAKLEKEKRKSDESDKQNKEFTSPSERMDETMTSDDGTPYSDKPTPPNPVRWAPTPAALLETPESPPMESNRMSHHELEMMKRKRKREEKKKEKRSESMGDGHRKDDRKKEEKKYKDEEEEDDEYEDEDEDEMMDEEEEEEEEAARMERTRRRLRIINERMKKFGRIARKKEEQRVEKWRIEEEKWRRRMYREKKWKRNRMIRDVPFDIDADRKETDTRRVRTLRRCSSTERLPHSFRLLSSLHSMNSMASEADSLTAALTDLRIGGETRQHRHLREQLTERERREVKEKKDTKKAKEEELSPDPMDLNGKIELFIRETKAMVEEELQGVEETTIREMSLAAIRAFISLSFDSLIPIFEKIEISPCINNTILRLVRIFSPIVNLAEAGNGCREECDEGEHKKCRMLLTMLLTLSEPHRMGAGEECLLPPNALYDCIEFSAPCQIRALIRGGCTFDSYYDEEGKNAAHRMMEKYSLIKLVWLIERGLDVNSVIMPKRESDLEHDRYDRPWKNYRESHEKAAFLSQLHSQRLTARSLAWTKGVQAMARFSLRPLTLVHSLNPHSYFHRVAAVTLCDEERRDFDVNDAVVLAVHSARVREGKGLRAIQRKTKTRRAALPELWLPYFLIDPAKDDAKFEFHEKYECTRAQLTVHNLDRPSASETVELTRLGSNGATTVFKVPKKEALSLISGRRFTECLLKVISPPEHSVILAQYFVVPFKTATG